MFSHIRRCAILWPVLILLLFDTAYCQNFSFINYTKDDGLPSNTVYNIFRDNKGLLWIGTDKGVVTYNGVSFETYTTLNGLPDNEIFFFQQDYEGRIWMSTANGELCYYLDGEFYNSTNTPYLKVPVKVTTVNFILLEKDSSITIGFYNYPLIVNICKKKLHVINVAGALSKAGNAEVLSAKKLNANRYRVYDKQRLLLVDSNGSLISSSNYINDLKFVYSIMQGEEYLLNEKGIYNMEQQKLLAVDNKNLLNRICRVYKSNHDFFLATFDGIFINNSIHTLDNVRVSSLTQDRNGNYWISTLDKGVYILNKNFSDISTYTGMYDDKITFAYADSQNVFFTTTPNNLFRFSKGNVQSLFNYARHNKNDKMPEQPAYIIKDKAYYSFYNQQLNYIPDIYQAAITVKHYNTAYLNNVKNTYAIGDNICVAFSNDIVIIDTKPQKNDTLSSLSVFSPQQKRAHLCTIGVDSRGRVLFSSSDSVFRIGQTGFIEHLPQFGNVSFKWGKLFGNYLLANTTNNQLWVGLLNDDKLIADSSIKEECIWNSAYLLDSTHILLSTSGPYRLLTIHNAGNGGQLKYSMQVIENPFIPKTVDYITAYRGQCYFFSKGAIFSVGIKTLLQKANQPAVYFTSIKTDRRAYTATGDLTLPYNEAEHVFVNFNVISFAGNSLIYEYSVSKNNIDNWHSIQNREINLTSLRYGHYTIKIRAKTMSSGYCTPAVIHMFVGKPFWANGWFIALSAIVFILMVIAVVTYIIKRQLLIKERQHELKIRFMKSEYKTLNALMNPHFIFNSLNNIQSFINNNDKLSANRYLNIFSSLVRQNMQNISKELISLQKEIELVNNYLVLEKLRFKTLLNFDIHIADDIDLDAIKVPPLLLQPIVENAIKHGLLPRQSEENHINITIAEMGDCVHIAIEDNGVGLNNMPANKGNHESFALNNIKNRIEKLREIYDQDINFDIIELQDASGRVTGTRSTIIIKA